jgi:hypothetical protein
MDYEQIAREIIEEANQTDAAGHWERGWRGLEAQAQEVFHAGEDDTQILQTAARL